MRCSTTEQAHSGAGLAAQRHALEGEIARRGWDPGNVVWIEDAGWSARSIKRPGLSRALALLRSGEASALLAAKTDRISRSVADFANLMLAAQREDWDLIALDCPADPSSPMGEAMVNVMVAFSQLERRLAGQRTKEALAARKAEGVVLGRPRVVGDHVADLAQRLRGDGLTLKQIASALHDAGHEPPNGVKWHTSTIDLLVKRDPPARLAA